MKYVNLQNDFKVDRVKNPNAQLDTVLTLDWIANGMMSGYNNGFKSDQRRIALGILSKMEAAKESGATFLELSPVEHSFLRTSFAQAISSRNELLAVTIAEDAIINATDTPPAQPATPGKSDNEPQEAQPAPQGAQTTPEK